MEIHDGRLSGPMGNIGFEQAYVISCDSNLIVECVDELSIRAALMEVFSMGSTLKGSMSDWVLTSGFGDVILEGRGFNISDIRLSPLTLEIVPEDPWVIHKEDLS